MSRVRTGCFELALIAGVAAACALPAHAQYPGHVDEEKQQNGTHLRATAILEYTGDLGKIKESRLVPIVVWDGMQYQPGGLYLAQPAPLAVLSGTQYELEAAGKPTGFFNIKDSEDLAGLWIGVGSFEAPPPPKPKASPAKSGHTYEVRDVRSRQAALRPPAGGRAEPGRVPAPAAAARDPAQEPARRMRLRSIRTGRRCTRGRAAAIRDRAAQAPALQPRANRTPTRIGQRFTGGPMHRERWPSAQPAIDPNRPHLGYTAPVDQSKLDKPTALFGLPPDMNQMAGSPTSAPKTRSPGVSRGRIQTMRTR